MSGTRYVVMILHDGDYEPWGDDGIEEEERTKIGNGEWAAYGVGLGEETSVGDIEPDYGTFVWGTVADAGYEGTYLGADKIQHEYLRSLAEDLINEYAEDKHRV